MCTSRLMRLITILFVMFLLSACISNKVYAPVTDATMIDPIPKNGMHRVRSGESLYSIAWRYGLDSRTLAAQNHFRRPYHIHVGQIIYLKGQSPVSVSPQAEITSPSQKIYAVKKSLPKQTIENSSHVSLKKVSGEKLADFREPTAPVSSWRWPAKGPVIAGFSDSNKGINIGGHGGDPIFATAAGSVVYSGSGLRGYGNLIIIEHNRSFLTAYAHNSALLVKEGQRVKSGQKIALMGSSGTKRIMLHFEIRKDGKPVNPLSYLNG